MDGFDTERSNHVNLHETPPRGGEDGLWKTYGTSISLGFLATTLLISMFVIMAIIEHLFRPNGNAIFRFSQHGNDRSDDSRPMHKLVHPNPHVQVGNASDLSVLMPGQKYPTYIAHPTPLPCSREGVYWPSHCET